MSSHSFGGSWTTYKLQCLSKYLTAYMQVMKKQNFQLTYIDAFAGTGWVTLKQSQSERLEETLPLFSHLEVPERSKNKEPVDGSARLALQIEPHFKKCIFIENDAQRFSVLQQLKLDFPGRDIEFIRAEANEYLIKICKENKWLERPGIRAVLFLDPYGMQVSWETIECIASTQAIDLWYLFPLGMALMRLLPNNGVINEACREKINKVLGTEGWYDAFYEVTNSTSLFGAENSIKKKASFDAISTYMVRRFETIFPGVAPNPKMLRNSTNNPLFLLCFASANPKGADIAVRIAQYILSK